MTKKSVTQQWAHHDNKITTIEQTDSKYLEADYEAVEGNTKKLSIITTE
jgi:hypothetical protein